MAQHWPLPIPRSGKGGLALLGQAPSPGAFDPQNATRPTCPIQKQPTNIFRVLVSPQTRPLAHRDESKVYHRIHNGAKRIRKPVPELNGGGAGRNAASVRFHKMQYIQRFGGHG